MALSTDQLQLLKSTASSNRKVQMYYTCQKFLPTLYKTQTKNEVSL